MNEMTIDQIYEIKEQLHAMTDDESLKHNISLLAHGAHSKALDREEKRKCLGLKELYEDAKEQYDKSYRLNSEIRREATIRLANLAHEIPWLTREIKDLQFFNNKLKGTIKNFSLKFNKDKYKLQNAVCEETGTTSILVIKDQPKSPTSGDICFKLEFPNDESIQIWMVALCAARENMAMLITNKNLKESITNGRL